MLLRLSIPFLCAVLKIGLQYSCQKKVLQNIRKNAILSQGQHIIGYIPIIVFVDEKSNKVANKGHYLCNINKLSIEHSNTSAKSKAVEIRGSVSPRSIRFMSERLTAEISES